MDSAKTYSLITDLGSTTTKAVLIDNFSAEILGIAHSATTVEAPDNDVLIGVYNAVKELEQSAQIPLMQAGSRAGHPRFLPNISYHSTSSAGGGLQILVIGLTLFDSASSARRAAYGAGGLIVGLFAIDDRLSAAQQMLNMRVMRPDMILISGGTDDGALGSVLRMVEILRIARPQQKYESQGKIPTIYAGNQAAVPIIKNMISNDFELYCLPNLRPSLEVENLRPTQEKVQELFMQRVMERAPGYSGLKEIVDSDILPTPMGLLKAIENMPESAGNIMLFDVGGATTDVFSKINGHLQRTVSANLGMSYSMQNVLKENGIKEIMHYLPPEIDEAELRNYIGNKSLFPTSKPGSSNEIKFEHAIAKAAIFKAFGQHREMHFEREKIGYLDKVKEKKNDRFREKFNYIADEKKYSFYSHDIATLIGAGGVFAHIQKPGEAIDILIGGYQPQGIVTLMIDRYFISPHLGLLSGVKRDLSLRLLNEECLKPLAVYIRPSFGEKHKRGILKISGDTADAKGLRSDLIFPDAFVYLPAKQGRSLKLQALNNCFLAGQSEMQLVSSDLPLIIDTRRDRKGFDPNVAAALDIYRDAAEAREFKNQSLPQKGKYRQDVELPYKGRIFVEKGDAIEPGVLAGENQFEPPRLFVIPVFSSIRGLSREQIEAHTLVKVGDQINFDQPLTEPMPLPGLRHAFLSPVRGKVEYIEAAAGIVVASEIQDYDFKPHLVDIAQELKIRSNKARAYLLKRPGDFVYRGESLARIIDKKKGLRVARAPSTGEVISYDAKTGVMELQYKGKARQFFAYVSGRVEAVEEGRSAQILYEAERLEACIGWGQKQYGILKYYEELPDFAYEDELVVLGFVPDKKEFDKLLLLKAKALILPSMEAAWLPEFLGEEQGVINTGLENVVCSLLLMQGFGNLPYSAAQMGFFKENSGKDAYIDPHTRIRAGVARAGIYVQSF